MFIDPLQREGYRNQNQQVRGTPEKGVGLVSMGLPSARGLGFSEAECMRKDSLSNSPAVMLPPCPWKLPSCTPNIGLFVDDFIFMNTFVIYV